MLVLRVQAETRVFLETVSVGLAVNMAQPRTALPAKHGHSAALRVTQVSVQLTASAKLAIPVTLSAKERACFQMVRRVPPRPIARRHIAWELAAHPQPSSHTAPHAAARASVPPATPATLLLALVPLARLQMQAPSAPLTVVAPQIGVVRCAAHQKLEPTAIHVVRQASAWFARPAMLLAE